LLRIRRPRERLPDAYSDLLRRGAPSVETREEQLDHVQRAASEDGRTTGQEEEPRRSPPIPFGHLKFICLSRQV
jgi:hypothetical protein